MEVVSGFLIATIFTWSLIGVEIFTSGHRKYHLFSHLGVQLAYTIFFSVNVILETDYGDDWDSLLHWVMVLLVHWLVAMTMIAVRSVKNRMRMDNPFE